MDIADKLQKEFEENEVEIFTITLKISILCFILGLIYQHYSK